MFWLLVAAIMASSYFALKRTEALSYYVEGRSYIARGDRETGVLLLKRALDISSRDIPLLDVYSRLCFAGLGKEEIDPIIDQGLKLFPHDLHLNVFRLVADSMGNKGERQHRAMEILRRVREEGILVLHDGRTWDMRKEEQSYALHVVAMSYNNISSSLVEKGESEAAVLALLRSLHFEHREKVAKALRDIYEK